MKKNFVLIPLVTLLFSCASTKYAGTAACTGRVCGPRGEPVANYQVSFGLGLTTVTGSNGMFLIPEMRSGTYTLTGRGAGWASVEKEISFVDRRSIVCVQVEPISAVYQRVESLLKSGLYEEAKTMLKREKSSNDKTELFQFYQKVVDYCQSPSERKKEKLSEYVKEEYDHAL